MCKEKCQGKCQGCPNKQMELIEEHNFKINVDTTETPIGSRAQVGISTNLVMTITIISENEINIKMEQIL